VDLIVINRMTTDFRTSFNKITCYFTTWCLHCL